MEAEWLTKTDVSPEHAKASTEARNAFNAFVGQKDRMNRIAALRAQAWRYDPLIGGQLERAWLEAAAVPGTTAELLRHAGLVVVERNVRLPECGVRRELSRIGDGGPGRLRAGLVIGASLALPILGRQERKGAAAAELPRPIGRDSQPFSTGARWPLVVQENGTGGPPTPRLFDRLRAALRARHYQSQPRGSVRCVDRSVRDNSQGC